MTQRNVTSSFKFEIGERSIFSADFFHLDFSDKTVSADFKINFWFCFPL